MNKEFNYLSEFINEIQVVCSKCEQKAEVISNPLNRSDTKLICPGCGFSKKWQGNASIYFSSNTWDGIQGILMGQPVDCYFKLPLWYDCDFKGNRLFAYNLKHLAFLKSYIEDRLRERKQTENGWSNASLESRLPKWMQSSKNRAKLIAKIKELEKK